MKLAYRLAYVIFLIVLISCTKKANSSVEENIPKKTLLLQTNTDEESITGIYETKPDSDDCSISIKIEKINENYTYFIKTSSRQLKGKATFTTNKSGEKFLVLEGIKWDEYEGDISNQEEDSILNSEPKELEIPVGIEAGYVKDTLTIQNYGNSMNSYTKLSECGRKYIQLIKK